MEKQTHYQVLGLDKNATSDMIRFAYERLLKDAKDKLQDSPLYYKKEQELNNAFSVLSNPELRQAYNKKLEKIANPLLKNTTDNAHYDSSGYISEQVVKIIFSKSFISFAVLVTILLITLPSSKDRVNKAVASKLIDNTHMIQKQQMELERARTERNFSYQAQQEDLIIYKKELELRRLEMEQQRLDSRERLAREKEARNERNLALREEREAVRAEEQAKRQKKYDLEAERRRKREDEYEAKRRSREFIRSTERTTELEKQKIRLQNGYNSDFNQ